MFNLGEVIASLSSVLPFSVNEESLIDGDVAPGADTVLVVLFDERLDTDSDGFVVVVTDVVMFTCGEEKIVGKDDVFCIILVLVEVTDVRVLGVFDDAVVCVPIVLYLKVEDVLLIEGDVIVLIGTLLVSSVEEVVTTSGGVLDTVSDVLMYVRGVEETSGFHVVEDTVPVLGRGVDGTDVCDTSVVVVTVFIVLLFTDGDDEIPDVDVVVGIETLLVETGEEVLGTDSDSAVVTGPDVIILICEICEDAGTVNEMAVVGKDPVLKEVSDVELLCGSSGVVILVSNVLPLTVEEELLLGVSVDVETDIVLAVPSDENRELDLD